MSEKIITKYSEVPARYVVGEPIFYRGEDNSNWVNKPADPREIPPVIYIGAGKNFLGTQQFQKVFVRIVESTFAAEPRAVPNVDETPESRREEASRLSGVSFHYSNKDYIEENYNNRFKEPVIVELLSETTAENSVEFSAKVNELFGGKRERNEIVKWVATNKIPGLGTREMFVRYLRAAVADGSVSVGIDLVDKKKVDSELLDAFEREVAAIAEKFTLRADEVDLRRSAERQKAVQKIAAELENVQGEVLLQGEFQINKEESSYTLRMRHPISEYIGQDVFIRLLDIGETLFEPQYQGEYKKKAPGSTMKLRVFGSVFQPARFSESGRNEVVIDAKAIF